MTNRTVNQPDTASTTASDTLNNKLRESPPPRTTRRKTTKTNTSPSSSSSPIVYRHHHHLREIYERDEEFILTTSANKIRMSSPSTPHEQLLQNQTVKQDQHDEGQEDPPQDLSDAAAAAVPEEPYQELKWNDLPLFLNEKFDNHDELLQQDKQTLPIHAGRTALLVVDVQPEYWSQCPAVRADFPHFPSKLQRLVAQCRQQKCKIIWVRADYRYAHSPWLVQFARLHRGNIPEEVYTPHDAEVAWEDFATPQGGEYVIPKTSWSCTRHTALMDLLKQSGIDTVLVCGLITSVCVQHSAFGIFEAGYRTLLVTDACADRGKARHDAALALYGDYMYELSTVDDLCDSKSDFYLRPAEPVWLTPHSVDTLVQPQIFNTLQDSVLGVGNSHNATTTSTSCYGYQYDEDDDDDDEEEDNVEERTATTSNKQGPTHYYTVEKTTTTTCSGNNGKPPLVINPTTTTTSSSSSISCGKDNDPSFGNDTTRTSTSSLSTLSSINIREGTEQPIEL